MTASDAFASLNRIVDVVPPRTPAFIGGDPILPTPFPVANAAAAALGLGASAASEIWRLRGGSRQDIAIDLNAAAASLVSFALLRLNGRSVPRPADNNATVGIYRGMDGRYIHLHGGFPHLERRTLDLLNAENDAEGIAAAVAKWNAFALEDALATMNQCGAVIRTEEEWQSSRQGSAMSHAPPILLKRIGDALRPCGALL